MSIPVQVSVLVLALSLVFGCGSTQKNNAIPENGPMTSGTNVPASKANASNANAPGSVESMAPEDAPPFDKAPELISMDPPRYPDGARKANVEGVVLVRVLVGADGRVKDVMIIQSIPMLDEAAADAAWSAVFKPGLNKGQPVPVYMVIPLEWNLRG